MMKTVDFNELFEIDGVNATAQALEVIEQWLAGGVNNKKLFTALSTCYTAKQIGYYDEAFRLYEINKILR